jgi:transposase-like protein
MRAIKREIISYSESFKLEIIRQLEEEGASQNELRRRYGIKGAATLNSWLKKYGKNHLINKRVRIETMEERDELQQLRAENKRLKIEYAELAIQHKCSEKVIELADRMFGMDLKKKYEQAQSENSRRKKR